MSGHINVEVVYALRPAQEIVRLRLPAGATAQDAVNESGIPGRHPGLRIESGFLGIYNRICEPNTLLQDGDRVEIYRPLAADPKQARRRRAAAAKGIRKA